MGHATYSGAMTHQDPTPRFHSAWIIVALIALAPFALNPLSSAAQNPQEPGHHEEGEHEEGPLHDIMESLKDHMRAIRRSLGAEDGQAASMEHAEAIKDLALQAVPHCPAPAEGLSELEQLQWRVDYQRKMLAVADGMLQLQLAVASGDLEAAQNLYRSVGGIKKEGHDTYDPEEDE